MKLVFSDVDGTFYNLGKEIPAINREAMAALQAQGDRFVFVSGRGSKQMLGFLEEIDSDCDFIFGNGAGYKLRGEEPVYRNGLTFENAERIIRILDRRQIFYHVHTSEDVYLKPMAHFTNKIAELREKFSELGPEGDSLMDFKVDFFTNHCGHVEDPITFLKENPQISILKVEFMEVNDESVTELMEELSNDQTYVFSSFPTGIEVVNPQSNKGAAIEHYLEMYPAAITYGIGDAENDQQMLATVDVAVAVENATPAIKAQCQLIIGDCDEGAVGKFIFEELLETKAAE